MEDFLPIKNTSLAQRYKRARELAGLSLAQAGKLLNFGEHESLEFLEACADRRVHEDRELQMAKVYGCAVEWLRGDEIPVPEALLRQLREAAVSSHDRDVVIEFAQMLGGRGPGRICRGREVEGSVTPASTVSQPRAVKVRYVKAQGQTRTHPCHWPGCDKQVPPAMWGCKAHWMRLPKILRDRIWNAYNPGQERDMSPSAEYLQVADDVQRWIKEKVQ